ncbi:hypothetical protein LguiA_013873 [Lonicera macranthoides]
MGNCMDTDSRNPNPSSTINTTRPSTSGTSNNNSNGVVFSATSSSAGQSGFSVAASDDTCATGEILPMPNLKTYTLADLKSATSNFKATTVLGVGGFGTVYKGWVDEKTLEPTKLGWSIALDVTPYAFVMEQVNFLGRLSHPNLVKLLGYCCEERDLLLVYEFLQKGSLENHLFRRGSTVEPLSWVLRLKIALGAARGLAFLHGSEKEIIYRDFKASNILLDTVALFQVFENYNAKISDFGLAKLGPAGGKSHVSTRVMGTYGYAAPEYIATVPPTAGDPGTSLKLRLSLPDLWGPHRSFDSGGWLPWLGRQLPDLRRGHLYVKSDVYGFGVVLLEMLTGLRALDTKRPTGRHNLIEWAKPLLPYKRKLKTIMDPRIEGQYSLKAALQAAELTLNCLEQDPRKRPSMKEVVHALEQIEAVR